MAVRQSYIDDVVGKLAHLPQGAGLAEAVETLSRKYHVSKQTINRWANQGGLRWRKERVDKGIGTLCREDALRVGALMQVTRRLTNYITLPACDAVEILQDSAMLTKDVSTSTCLRALREHKVSARDITRPTPHVTMRYKHPNHVWEFDVTNCLQYFLDDKKGLGERDVEGTLYRNKLVKTAKTIKKELLRYVVVDMCSGAFYMQYFYASGEKAVDGIEFLYNAMRPKNNEQYRLHGVPQILYVDRGSIAHAHSFKGLMTSLGVQLIAHLPGNPRAKGGVEGMMKHLMRFEARLGGQRPASLDELNAWAMDWAVMFNALKLFRGTATRSALWNMIRTEQLRLCPDWEVLSECLRSPAESRRVNGNLIINYRGEEYRLPDSNIAGQKVIVSFNPYRFPVVFAEAEDGTVYEVEPLTKDQFGQLTDGVTFGDFRSHKHTDTQRAKKEMEEVAEGWGITFKGAADKRRASAPPLGHETPLQMFGHQAEKVAGIAFMDKKGTDIVLPSPIHGRGARGEGSPRVPLIGALRQVVAEIGRPLTKQENADIRARYTESMTDEEIQTLTDTLRGKEVQASHETADIVHWRAKA